MAFYSLEKTKKVWYNKITMENKEIDFTKILSEDRNFKKISSKKMRVSDVKKTNSYFDRLLESGNGWKIYLFAKDNDKHIDIKKAGEAIALSGDAAAAFHFARRFKKEIVKDLKDGGELFNNLRDCICNSNTAKYIFELADEYQKVKLVDLKYLENKICRMRQCVEYKYRYGLEIAGADQKVISALIAKENRADYIIECAKNYKQYDVKAVYEGLRAAKDAEQTKRFAKEVKGVNIPALSIIMSETGNVKEMYEFSRRYQADGVILEAIQKGLCETKCNPIIKAEYLARFMRRFQDEKKIDLKELQTSLEETKSAYWLIDCAENVKNSDKVSIARTLIDLNDETSLGLFVSNVNKGDQYIKMAQQIEESEQKSRK